MSSHPPPSPSSLQQQHQDLAPSSPFNNSQFGDTTMTKVFVGGLAWETQRDGVRRYFEQFGEILEAVVITDKATGRSKGYGFVTFRDPEGARRACEEPTPVIDGRRANCNLASLGVRSRPGTPQQGGRFRGGSPTAGPSPGRASGSPQHMPYSYQQAFPYPPYGYQPYNQQEYIYPSNMVYNGPFIVTPPFTPPFYGGAPPPPSLGSPTAGLYTYQFSPTNQTFQVPFPYPPLGAQMSSQNQPSPSGLLTPDQSPPTSGVGGTGPQHGLAQHHFSGSGAAPQQSSV